MSLQELPGLVHPGVARERSVLLEVPVDLRCVAALQLERQLPNNLVGDLLPEETHDLP